MNRIHTIGHSNNRAEKFDALLKAFDIDMLVDCRSNPRSRWPQHNRKQIEQRMASHEIIYEWQGDIFGGDCKWTPESIQLLLDAARDNRICIMCAEGDAKNCHRYAIATDLVKQGASVHHIMSCGKSWDHDPPKPPE